MSIHVTSRTLVERTVGGKLLSIETGHLAKQASGSVVVRIGDTMTLVALVAAPGREGLDFFPLSVDYREKTYSAGKFPGGFIKREGRPTTKEILT
jgi:polyribonucleotide nucleotidyltransferase